MVLLEGKKVVEKKSKYLLEFSNSLFKKYSKKPCIAILSLNMQDAGKTYVNKIIKNCDKFNIDVQNFNLENKSDFIATFDKVSRDVNISGIMFQEPIESDLKKLLEKVNPLKDVEGITASNLGKLILNIKDKIVPCTAEAVMDILEYYNIDVASKKVVILGRSTIVGKPLALELISKDATVTLCHSKTIDVKKETLSADILITAIGKAKYITADYIKDGASVIDVGINFLDGKLVGDVDFESVKNKVNMITPVPGGVGIVTNYCLIENILKTFEMQNELGEDNK